MMRKLLILFAVLLMASMAAQAAWYPMQIDTGKAVQSHGGGTDYAGQVVIQTIPTAETSDDDQLFDSIPLNATTNFLVGSIGNGSSYFNAQIDVPRNVIATASSEVTGTIKLTGTDLANAIINENLTWASESGVKASAKAFKTVTRADGYFSIANSSPTMKIGTGNVLGLNSYLPRNTVIAEFVNGARETTAGTVTTSSTVLSQNTIDTYTAPGGYVTLIYYVLNS